MFFKYVTSRNYFCNETSCSVFLIFWSALAYKVFDLISNSFTFSISWKLIVVMFFFRSPMLIFPQLFREGSIKGFIQLPIWHFFGPRKETHSNRVVQCHSFLQKIMGPILLRQIASNIYCAAVDFPWHMVALMVETPNGKWFIHETWLFCCGTHVILSMWWLSVNFKLWSITCSKSFHFERIEPSKQRTLDDGWCFRSKHLGR